MRAFCVPATPPLLRGGGAFARNAWADGGGKALGGVALTSASAISTTSPNGEEFSCSTFAIAARRAAAQMLDSVAQGRISAVCMPVFTALRFLNGGPDLGCHILWPQPLESCFCVLRHYSRSPPRGAVIRRRRGPARNVDMFKHHAPSFFAHRPLRVLRTQLCRGLANIGAGARQMARRIDEFDAIFGRGHQPRRMKRDLAHEIAALTDQRGQFRLGIVGNT